MKDLNVIAHCQRVENTMKKLFLMGLLICLLIPICFVASMFIGGFIFGYTHAEGASDLSMFDPGRVFIGLIFAILTPIFGGYPPKNEAGVGEPFNAWPEIISTFIVLVFLVFMVPIVIEIRKYFLKRKTKEDTFA